MQSKLGAGTSVHMRIPLTLAIIPALIVTCGGDRYAIPQVSLLELVRLEGDQVRTRIELVHGAPVHRLRGRLLPLVYLHRALHPEDEERVATNDVINIVVLQADHQQFGLVVDEIKDTEEIVVKPLSKQLKGVIAFAGATIMGDGKVALILDALGLAQSAHVISEKSPHAVKKKESADERKRVGATGKNCCCFKSASTDAWRSPFRWSLVWKYLLPQFSRDFWTAAGRAVPRSDYAFGVGFIGDRNDYQCYWNQRVSATSGGVCRERTQCGLGGGTHPRHRRGRPGDRAGHGGGFESRLGRGAAAVTTCWMCSKSCELRIPLFSPLRLDSGWRDGETSRRRTRRRRNLMVAGPESLARRQANRTHQLEQLNAVRHGGCGRRS